MPDELKREELFDQVKNSQVVSPEYAAFVNDIKALSEQMDAFMKMDGNGWHLLDRDDIRTLFQKYHTAGASLEKFLDASKKSTDPQVTAARKLGLELGKILSRDLMAFRQYTLTDKIQDQKSLQTILSDTRIPTVDLNKRQIKTVGGALSSRIPMKLKRPNGKTVSGVFTPVKIFDPKGALKENADKIAAMVTNQEGAAMVRDLYDKYCEYYTAHPDEHHVIRPQNEAANVKGFMEAISNDRIVSKNKIVQMMATVYGKTEREVKNLVGSKNLDKLRKTLDDDRRLDTELIVNSEGGIPAKSRIDIRNSAMSTVADLLGMPNIIARSRAMKLKKDDGTVIEGTFMEEAKGNDMSKPTMLVSNVNADSLKGTNGNAFRQIADLQVLDYLCGNVDRHGNNIFYQFDEKGKLTGIQGIDNDCSFGDVTSPIGVIKSMVTPGQMPVMSKKTADRVMAITPEQLKFSLRGQLEEAAIEKAAERLGYLQMFIENSRAKQKTDPSLKTKIQRNNIIELEDKDWKNLNLDQVMEAQQGGLFLNAATVIQANARKAKSGAPGLKAESVGFTNKGTAGGLLDQEMKAKGLQDKLDKRTSMGRTSPEYQAVERAVEDYKNLQKQIAERIAKCAKEVRKGNLAPENVYGQYVTQFDLIQMKDKLQKMKETSETYLDNKNQTLHGSEPSKYTGKRMDVVREVKTFAENAMNFSEEEKATVSENERKATELFVAKEVRKNENPVIKQEEPQAGGGIGGPGL